MMYYLWRALAVCVVLGSIQWMYTHPDSQMSQTAIYLWSWIKLQWTLFTSLLRNMIESGLDIRPAGAKLQ